MTSDGRLQASYEEHDTVPSREYWLCQLGGWSAFALLQVLASLAGGTAPPSVARAVLLSLGSALGLVATHLLHLVIRRRQWLRRRGPALLARLAAAVLVTAALLDYARWMCVRVLAPSLGGTPATAAQVFVGYIWWTLLVMTWVALYLVAYEIRERRRQELRAMRLEVVAQEAQLRALRAQLNPHFLFNCLNGLRELVGNDPEHARGMLTRLSDLLRYALRSDQTDLVLLAEEVRGVEDYLMLEAVRFDERLRVAWDIAPDALAVSVPPLLLQTLVENAVKHGVARRPDGGEIAIVARVDYEALRLDVVNSGRLADPSAASGLGLRNASERLRLLYGDRARLSLHQVDPDRVRAHVAIPATARHRPGASH